MWPKKMIVITRQAGDESSIKALREAAFTDLGDVARAIEDDLRAWGLSQRNARKFASEVTGMRVGSIDYAEAADRYYRLLFANTTSNGVPVVPGLRVLDYDQRKGHVVAAQFMAQSSLSPGGEYFNGWYHVEEDDRPGRTKLFNGERLKAL